MMLDIVNMQNLQIQVMYDYLDAKRLPEADNCEVFVETIPKEIAMRNAMSSASVFSIAAMGMVMTSMVGVVLMAIIVE
jgi:hypothetical protein